jgi:hypothetical protein
MYAVASINTPTKALLKISSCYSYATFISRYTITSGGEKVIKKGERAKTLKTNGLKLRHSLLSFKIN